MQLCVSSCKGNDIPWYYNTTIYLWCICAISGCENGSILSSGGDTRESSSQQSTTNGHHTLLKRKERCKFTLQTYVAVPSSGYIVIFQIQRCIINSWLFVLVAARHWMKTHRIAILCMEMECVSGLAVRRSLETFRHFSSEWWNLCILLKQA